MENYINFVKYFQRYKITGSFGGIYSDSSDSDNFDDNIERGINDCKIFNIDKNIKKLLLLTKTPENNDNLKLPFNNIFVDVCFNKEELKQLINIDYEFEEVIGLLIKKGEVYQKKGVVGDNIRISFLYKDTEKAVFNTTFFNVNLFEEYKYLDDKILYDEKGLGKDNKKNMKLVKNFVKNFLNFVNNPEIEIVESVMSEEQNKKREDKGKCRIPSQHFIRLQGELKRYVNSISNNQFTYSHRFWVRGHFRTLKADRYKENIGKRKWILPYTKGKGLLFDKEYNISDKKKGVDA